MNKMEKLIFTANEKGRHDKMIRVDQCTLCEITKLAEKTGLPIAVVTARLLRFALANTEVRE